MAAFTAITTDCTDRTAAFGYIDSVQIQNSGVRTYVRNGAWAESPPTTVRSVYLHGKSGLIGNTALLRLIG